MINEERLIGFAFACWLLFIGWALDKLGGYYGKKHARSDFNKMYEKKPKGSE